MENTYCVIMAGGIGSRFWPMSTPSKPKQFLDILGTGKTLLQQTFDRFMQTCEPEKVFVVTNEKYKYLVSDQLPQIPEENILCEPLRRNTAPCIAFAAYKIKKANPNATIVVSPADHLVLKEDSFTETIKLAIEQARNNSSLITLGIKPSRPDTGYGYIQFMDEDSHPDKRVKKVKTFMEKPSIELAKQFISSGDFYWNSGIFIFNSKAIINAFDDYLNDLHQIFSEGNEALNTSSEKAFIEQAFEKCPNISIDYGIMEKASNVDVVLADFGWSDLGTWGSLYTHLDKDSNNNGVVGDQVNLHETKDTVVHIQGNQKAIIQGLEDYIVVLANDTLLISKKSEEQRIKSFVNSLNNK